MTYPECLPELEPGDYYVHCHAEGHGHPIYGDETPQTTAWHPRSASRLIEWPWQGGALWHCPEHVGHMIRHVAGHNTEHGRICRCRERECR